MSVGIDKLLCMAEQIAANVSIDKDSQRTGEKLARHMQRFWDPRMRQDFLEYASSEPGTGELSPALAAAAERLQADAAST
ncbi:MAG: formate dehydrogenase subunit delta [Pseudomonadota bacterium]